VGTTLEAEVLLSLALTVMSEQRVESVLQKTVQGLAAQPGVALARIWLLPSIHLPSSWRQLPDAPEGVEHLHLVASAGTPLNSPGEDWSSLHGYFARFPMQVGKVGQVAAERHPILVKDISQDYGWIVRPEWAQREGIRTFAGYPLVFRDNPLGVIAIFSRIPLEDEEFAWLGVFANHAAAAITNTRAFEDLKKAEEALRSNERNLSLLSNVIPTFIHVLRTDGSVLYVNQAVLSYTGLTLEDVQKEDYRARYFHPEDVERLREERREALTRPVPFENEQRLLGKDGRYRWFLIRYNPLLDEQGRIDRWYVAAFDIEDRKRAEAQVEQAYLHLAEAQRLSKTGSFITDLSVDDHNWSEEAFRIFEFDPATKLTLQMIRGMVHPEDLPSFDAVIARGMTGTDVDFVFRIVMPRGGVKHVRGIARITEQVAGRPLFIGALQDVTESKVAEEALNRARSELAHMARVTTLSALTASIAHEVNQPLAAIVADGTASLNWLAAAPPDLDRVRDALDAIVTDGHRAAEVIQRIRQLATKSAPRKDRLDVNGVVGDVEPLVRAELRRHEVALTLDLARGLPSVIGDRVQLQQVLLNLVMNGMEAMATVTDRPRELLIRSRPHEENQVLVAVHDTGVGIDPKDLDQLFNAFFTTKPAGMGIGLSICRSIVEAHGGRLWATPNAAYGATFHFALPGIW
jgi:PAS domain S-box-containing protein